MKIQHSYRSREEGVLYLVPTPIGNLGDLTYRAVDILQSADLLLVEDSRQTGKLRAHFGIETPMLSYQEHKHEERLPEILQRLEAGETLAQLSDAGMPSISDPGRGLVAACLAAGFPVLPLPGASAGITALVASGLASQPFTFIGFLPKKKKAQAEALRPYASRPETLIFYESPYRLAKTLENLVGVFGGERPAVVARELTKKFETFYRGQLGELAAYFAKESTKGEICLLIAGQKNAQGQDEDDFWERHKALPLKDLVPLVAEAKGYRTNDAIKYVAKRLNVKKQYVYQTYHDPKKGGV